MLEVSFLPSFLPSFTPSPVSPLLDGSGNKVTSISARKSGVQFWAWSVSCSDTGSQHGCFFPTRDPTGSLLQTHQLGTSASFSRLFLTTSLVQRCVGLSRVETPATLKADASAWREQWAPDLVLIRAIMEEFFFKWEFLNTFINDVATASLE